MSFYLPALARRTPLVAGGKVQWATRLAGSGAEQGYSIASDTQNNIYVTGNYSSTPMTIYNADGSTFATLANTTIPDAFLVKYNSSGQALWATRISGTGSEIGLSVTVDFANDVYITGSSTSATLIINSYGAVSGGTISLVQYGTLPLTSQDIFIVKYNPTGQAQWATSIGGTGNDTSYAIKVDYSNNVYVVGNYANQTCTFRNYFGGGGGGGQITTSTYAILDSTNNPNGSIFVIKYSSSGQAQWVTYLASAGNIVNNGGLGVDTDNNIYISGEFSAPMTINSFGSVVGTTVNETLYGTLNPTGQNIFLVKFNLIGTAQWATSIGGISLDNTDYSDISIDFSKNIYICGWYTSNPLTINSFSSVSGGNVIVSAFGTLTNAGSSDIFIAKYNSSGTALWATKCEAGSIAEGYSIVTDVNQNVYLLGYYFNSSCTIYSYSSLSSPGGSINLSSYGTIASIGIRNILLVKFSSSGQAQWATNLGGGTNARFGYGITRDNSNYIYITGYYTTDPLTINNFDTVLGGNINTTNFGSLANSGSSDVFIIKYSP